MEQHNNQITVRGTMVNLPAYSHDSHGKRFFKFFLEVPRLSNAVDILPVVAEERILNGFDLSGGEMVTVIGQIRSHNDRVDGIRRLMVFIYAYDMMAEDDEPINDVMIKGTICKDPIFRRTPLGRDICDVMLAVPRAFKRADYLPCILWGRTAMEISRCSVGDEVKITGRLQSRFYTKITDNGPIQRTAYEISALTAEVIDDSL